MAGNLQGTIQIISQKYPQTMGIPLKRGREF
jgi:hypothetical protein